MPGGPKIGQRREQAIAALLSEKSVAEAAAKVGVNYRTLQGWLYSDREFQAAFRAARQEILTQTVSRLLALTGEAVEALARNLGPDVPAPSQIKAALAVLRQAVAGAEQLDLVTELADLKAAIREAKHGERGASAGSAEAESNAARADGDGSFLVDESSLAS
jgi:hypothetical protein